MSPKQKPCLFPHLNLFFHLSPSSLCHKGQQNLARKEEKREKRKEKREKKEEKLRNYGSYEELYQNVKESYLWLRIL